VALGHQFFPAVQRNTLLVTRRGAGAKKGWGPAPPLKNNILKIRNLYFPEGAGNHEKSAPAPSSDQVCSRLSLSLVLEQGFQCAVSRNDFLVVRE